MEKITAIQPARDEGPSTKRARSSLEIGSSNIVDTSSSSSASPEPVIESVTSQITIVTSPGNAAAVIDDAISAISQVPGVLSAFPTISSSVSSFAANVTSASSDSFFVKSYHWWNKGRETSSSKEYQCEDEHAAYLLASYLGYNWVHAYAERLQIDMKKYLPVEVFDIASFQLRSVEELSQYLISISDALECEPQGTTYYVKRKSKVGLSTEQVLELIHK